MTEMQQAAKEKIEAEEKAAKYDRYGAVLHTPVRKTLEEFITQDEEFAQAVVQGGSPQGALQGRYGEMSEMRTGDDTNMKKERRAKAARALLCLLAAGMMMTAACANRQEEKAPPPRATPAAQIDYIKGVYIVRR